MTGPSQAHPTPSATKTSGWQHFPRQLSTKSFRSLHAGKLLSFQPRLFPLWNHFLHHASPKPSSLFFLSPSTILIEEGVKHGLSHFLYMQSSPLSGDLCTAPRSPRISFSFEELFGWLKESRPICDRVQTDLRPSSDRLATEFGPTCDRVRTDLRNRVCFLLTFCLLRRATVKLFYRNPSNTHIHRPFEVCQFFMNNWTAPSGALEIYNQIQPSATWGHLLLLTSVFIIDYRPAAVVFAAKFSALFLSSRQPGEGGGRKKTVKNVADKSFLRHRPSPPPPSGASGRQHVPAEHGQLFSAPSDHGEGCAPAEMRALSQPRHGDLAEGAQTPLPLQGLCV